SLTEVAELNGGRLPLGVTAATDPGPVAVATAAHDVVTVWIDEATGSVLDVEIDTVERTVAQLSVGALPLGAPTETAVVVDADEVVARAILAEQEQSELERVDDFEAWERMAA